MAFPNPTKPPSQNHNPEPPVNRRSRFLFLNRTSIIALSSIVVAGVAGGAWWLRNFVYQELAPLVQQNLIQTLNRPVQLGQVEQFSLNSLRFGASSVPATPTDPDRVLLAGVEVVFDPLALIFTRTLKLDITLLSPNLYIQQDQEGRWVSTTIGAAEKEGLITTDLNKIRFRNANVVLVSNVAQIGKPSPQNTLTIAQIDGVAEILENNQLIQFDLTGEPIRGGRLELQGQFRPKTGAANLQVQTQNFLASDLTRLLELPLDLQAGRVDSNLKVELNPQQLTGLYGTANLKGVTAKVNNLPQAFNNSGGTLSFQGTQIGFNQVTTSYGKIAAIANGSLDTAGSYNISANAPAVTVANAQQTLNLTLPVPISGIAQASLKVTGLIAKPFLAGTIVTTQPTQVDKVSFSNVRANFTFATAAEKISFENIVATPSAGGKITGGGNIQLGKPGLDFNLVAQNIPGDAIARLYGVSPDIKVGTVTATTKVSGTPTTPQTLVSWQAPQASYPAKGEIIISNGITSFRDTVVNIAGGRVRGTGQLANNRWQAQLQANGIQLGRLTQVPPALQTPISGTFNLAGTTASFQPNALRASGSGRVNLAGGTVTATNLQVAQGRWQAQLQANNVQTGRLAEVPPALQGGLTGTFNLAGTTASFQPETIRGSGRARLNAGGGVVTASNIQLAQKQWQAGVNVAQVQLNRFSPELRGLLSGQLRVAGNLDTVNLSAIRAAGNVRFSEGIAIVQQPLVAQVQWDGEKVIVERATAPNLQANGLIFARVAGVGAPEITNLNLNVRAQNYNLQELPFQLPSNVDLVGVADFTGTVSGSLPTPNVVGALQLEELVVNNLAFEPLLTGNLDVSADGVELEVTGDRDRIALNLNENYRPIAFLVQRDEAIARGESQGENLLVNIENFPLAALNINPPSPVGAGKVSGLLTGDLQINPETYAVVGDIAVANPAIGRIQGNQFVAQFSYADGAGTVSKAEFVQGTSRYALTGSINQTPRGPEFKAQANITQGQIQNILTALQIFELEDLQRGLQPPTYGNANDLNTVAVGLPEAHLLTQVRRFSEIQVLLQQQRQQRRDASPLPPLEDFQGAFSGEISLNGSLQTGVAVNFDLEGQNWEWGEYNANQVIVQGSFENGIITLLPLRIESGETLLAFNGQIGGAQQSGQLRVRNFPVDVLNNFVTLPVDLAGDLNATATLAGTVENPQAIGELQLVEAALNQKSVESATASFSYNNARLNFGSSVVVAGPEPIAITASIPYQLPFAEVAPDSDEISLDVNVQNEGLALLNLLTNQVAWEDGQGRVQLQVRGTLEQPLATGIATIDNATISAAALPEPLTDVTGTARFDGNHIDVEGIQGKFSQGNIVAQGVIPLFGNLQSDSPDFNNPLTVNLDKLALNLPNLYQGGATGNVVIRGSVFNPILGGEVLLANGQVILAGSENAIAPTTNGNSTGSVDSGTAVEFNNLLLTLGNDIAITRSPILNFQARGSLNLNGALDDLRPDGTISLRRGSVNLFTTQFVLARGYEHTAVFTPEQALDPTLDIRLVAAVAEVTRTRVPSVTTPSEISEPLATDFGALQTVRVQATVTGPASRLFENLELTSNPSRSEPEIISLIGGSFIQTLESGDTTQGLANLAGTALLGTFQGTVTNIGSAIGLSELRLFPTIVTSEERSRTSTLGLAAEAGVDISRNVSVSALKVLTANQPTQFGLSYRVNEQVRLRASTDFSGDSQAVVEYVNQF